MGLIICIQQYISDKFFGKRTSTNFAELAQGISENFKILFPLEAILITILQPKRSSAGPHFRHCFLINKDTYSRTRYTIEILTLNLLGHACFVRKNTFLHVLSSIYPTSQESFHQ